MWCRLLVSGVERGAGEHGSDGPGAGPGVGARPHLDLRRRPRPGDGGRQQRRRRQLQSAGAERQGAGPLPPDHPPERPGPLLLGPRQGQRHRAQQGHGRQGRLRNQPAPQLAHDLPQGKNFDRNRQRLSYVRGKLRNGFITLSG